ncbi:hypothetical protein [Bifidobacterium phasiani]|uniref:Uncharacterized protein n=1 Tax=Bifidobacterium phasiani TaxID=2834431 RepID=A0ABS6W651_9BIFI|nr:hypothetical protein [Bifidobacterium phasiani]MBW3081960.1 hypothetical protein [Bifidobacterium phasiani]
MADDTIHDTANDTSNDTSNDIADDMTGGAVDDGTAPDPVTGDAQTADASGQTPVGSEGMFVLDLRPAAESAKSELLRLGLRYDRTDEASGVEQWRDYQRHLLAEFPAEAGTPVTIQDTDSGNQAVLDTSRLRLVSRILVSGDAH